MEPVQKILSKIGNTDFEFTKDDSKFKYAPYYKRVLSLIIDAVFLYAIIGMMYYFYPRYYDFWFDISYLFVASISTLTEMNRLLFMFDRMFYKILISIHQMKDADANDNYRYSLAYSQIANNLYIFHLPKK